MAAALLKVVLKSRRDRFGYFLKGVQPSWEWDWPYLKYIRGELENVTRGITFKLMLFMPPRHGKSEMVTVRYPVYRLKDDPTLMVIVAAYNQALAEKFSRKSRRAAQVADIDMSKDRAAAHDWETTSGGGVRAAGVGVGVTGHGADLIIVDDPVKNREEAESHTYRDRVWDWYTNDLYTRLEPGGAIILIMTRWHDDDLAGRILKSEDGENWRTISLPAFAEEGDLLGRTVGEPLCPARFDTPALEAIKKVLGRDFNALYQQKAIPREGEMFKREFLEIVEVAPEDVRRVRYWDKAGTAGAGARTAGVRMSTKDGVYYLEDVIAGQWASADRERTMRSTAVLDGKRVRIVIEQEPGSGGKDSAAASVKNLAGFVVSLDRVTGDKILRAEPLSSQWAAGNVKVVRGAWNALYINELLGFPSGSFKDMVDASSGAFNHLTAGGVFLA